MNRALSAGARPADALCRGETLCCLAASSMGSLVWWHRYTSET